MSGQRASNGGNATSATTCREPSASRSHATSRACAAAATRRASPQGSPTRSVIARAPASAARSAADAARCRATNAPPIDSATVATAHVTRQASTTQTVALPRSPAGSLAKRVPRRAPGSRRRLVAKPHRATVMEHPRSAARARPRPAPPPGLRATTRASSRTTGLVAGQSPARRPRRGRRNGR
jgi:hypothetical protein